MLWHLSSRKTPGKRKLKHVLLYNYWNIYTCYRLLCTCINISINKYYRHICICILYTRTFLSDAKQSYSRNELKEQLGNAKHSHCLLYTKEGTQSSSWEKSLAKVVSQTPLGLPRTKRASITEHNLANTWGDVRFSVGQQRFFCIPSQTLQAMLSRGGHRE